MSKPLVLRSDARAYDRHSTRNFSAPNSCHRTYTSTNLPTYFRRDGYNGRDPRDGGEKKSKKDKKQKKHKKSSKREQRRNSSAERSPSPRRNSSNDLGDRDTERRRQADRGGDDRRTRRAGDDRKREDPPDNDDDVDRKRRRRDASGGDRNGGNSDTATIRRKNDNDSGRRSDSRERQPEPSEGAWLRANIRVRVVHKSYAGGRAYLGKGRVVDVPRIGQATVRMDLGELVLEGDLAVMFFFVFLSRP